MQGVVPPQDAEVKGPNALREQISPIPNFVHMPRYLFALRHSDHDDLDNDPDGMDLADDVTAREFAVKIIRGLLESPDENWKGWVMEVTQGERHVWNLPFDAIEPAEHS